MAYTPYTSIQCKAEIARIFALITEHSGKSNQSLDNDTDSIQMGDIMTPLYAELSFWQDQLKIAESQEGITTNQVRFVRYDMGI